MKTFWKFLYKNKILLLVAGIFLINLSLRIYQNQLKFPFGYDQVDNAWAAKSILVDHRFTLVGMVAKENSGIYIGPLYYYLVALFYFLFNLNPVASNALAIFSSVLTFFTIFYVFKKLFSTEFAIIAVLINSFAFHALIFDTVQWPVQLLPAVSLIIFYLLYKVILGDAKKIMPLAVMIGVAFNLHFTAVFFLIIVVLSLPFFPRTKEALKYIFISLPLFLVFLVPNIIYSIINKSSNSHLTSYIATYYHGFHLRRLIQLLGDALIQFNPYLVIDKLAPLKIILFPLFFVIYLFKSLTTETKKFLYLIFLWFIVPWFVFATYKGEISDYYFVINRFIVLLILSYFIYLIWRTRYLVAKLGVVVVLLIYCGYGFMNYLQYKDMGLYEREAKVINKMNRGEKIGFMQGNPESYLYWYFMRQKGITVF